MNSFYPLKSCENTKLHNGGFQLPELRAWVVYQFYYTIFNVVFKFYASDCAKTDVKVELLQVAQFTLVSQGHNSK